MKIKLIAILPIAAMLLLTLKIHAQTALSAAGGQIDSSAEFVCFTIGQVFQISDSSAGLKFSEGVQQPYEILLSSRTPVRINELECIAFPNPTDQSISIQFNDVEMLGQANSVLRLYNVHGQCLSTMRIIDPVTEISLEQYPAGTYFLQIADEDGGVLKILRIIKS